MGFAAMSGTDEATYSRERPGVSAFRARGRRCPPHLFRLCARRGRPLGQVPVTLPRSQGAQRDGRLVPPPRRVQRGLSEVVMASERASRQAFLGVSILLFAASAAAPVVWCASMMCEMPMPGDWTMSMAWMRMPGQTWPGAAVSFLGMWVAMMVAMMLPSLVPMLWRLPRGRWPDRRAAPRSADRARGRGLLLRLAAFPLGAALAAIEMEQPSLARAVPIAIGVVVLIAGFLQLTAWKARHLDCCREAPGRV